MFNQKKEQKKMKKFWNLMLAALVIFGAVACTENQEENIPEAKKEPVLSFVANIDVDETRTDLKEVGGKWTTDWSGDDILNVYNHEVSDATFTFVNSVDEPTVFKCTDERVLDLIGWPVQIDNSDNFNSTTGKKGGSLYADVENFQPNANISLTVNSSFFRFSSYFDVTLELSSPGVETYQPFVKDDGTKSNTITLPAGDDVWVAFQTYSNCTLTATINGQVIKSKEGINFVDQMIYNLGTLGKKSEYGVVGSFQTPTTWDVAAPVAMYEISGGWVVAKNVELYKSDEFKIVKGNSWTTSFGLGSVGVVEENKEVAVTSSNSQNMKVAKNGKFDISFNATTKKIKVVCVEEYTDLKVNITIDNKANWSPLTITLKDGDSVIANKATVTGNKFPVSGEYIGKTLSCQFFSGSKQSEVMNVAITKAGATITLEETIIKLKVQLTTQNAKDWWGNTMKIYVWGSGTSLDTSWPGNTMTSEGNYTWSIIVPSELVGKKINYIINNGGSWQSKDSTVTIKAEGNTINASDIGIN